MRIEKELPTGLLMQSQINCVALSLPDELDDLDSLRAALGKQDRRFKHAPPRPMPVSECGRCSAIEDLGGHGRCQKCAREVRSWNLYMTMAMREIRQGKVKHTKVLNVNQGPNSLVRGFYTDFFARLGGTVSAPSSNQTLYIEYFAVGTDYSATNFSDTQLNDEIYRAVPGEFYDDTVSTFYATTYLKKSQGNPDGDTTATAGTTTTITVNDPTGFATNGRAQVETDSTTYNFTISNVAGSVLTCTDITGGALTNAGAFSASDTPDSGDTVKSLHCEGACFIGGAASATENSGNMMNRRVFEQLKDDSVSLLYDYILACTSVEV